MNRESSDGPPDNSAAPSTELLSNMEADAGMGVSADPYESEIQDDDTDVWSPSFGLPVLEQVLLAIIDANPGADIDRRKRLNNAMQSLVQRPSAQVPLTPHPETGRKDPDWSDEQAILWMAERWASDRPKIEGAGLSKAARFARRVSWWRGLWLDKTSQTRSDLSLAEEAARRFFPSVDENYTAAMTKRLAAIFSGESAKKRLSWAKAGPYDVRRTYAYRSTQHDYVGETRDAQDARKIGGLLRKAGVKVRFPD